MTSDRVMRCGHDHKVYSLTLGEKGFKYLDFPAYETPSKDLIYSRNSYSYYYADTIPDDDSMELISNLMNHQYYHEALLEIIRSELLMENFSVELFINKVICLMSLGEYEKALFEYENRCPPEHKTNAELAYQIALVYYRTDNFSSALQFTSIAARNCRDAFCNGKISLLTGLLYAHQGDWGNSYNAFDSLKDSENFRDVALMNARLSENAVSIKRKSPLLAGVMSVIPGLGYAYSGHFQTAISALPVNGLLAFATYSNFSKANYGMGALTAVFNVSFYLGNVYGSVNSAKRYNQMQKQSIINKLKFNSNL
jgi:tetratricopeptide (TPR) repeat protein